MKKLLLAISTLTILAMGGEYEDGLEAFQSGDYRKAESIYEKLATQGDAKAMNELAYMYQYARARICNGTI